MQAKSCRFSALGVIAIATAGLVRVPAKAQCCDLVDQKRAVTTWAYDLHCGGDASDSDLAVDFGLFDRTIHATVACALPPRTPPPASSPRSGIRR